MAGMGVESRDAVGDRNLGFMLFRARQLPLVGGSRGGLSGVEVEHGGGGE